jgi:DNA end-binding protein Ku
MAARPFWKGYLKLSLVTCRVAMVTATSEAEKIRFHTLNGATGNRVVSQYVDAVSGEAVDEADEAKGYPRDEDSYVILEDDELESVALESTRTIEIDVFVPADSIEWIWYDKPHYLVPDDEVGEEAFSVIRDAMASTGMVGIARLVLYRRERAVLLEPRDRGIVVWTLHFGDEVRDAGGSEAVDRKVDGEAMKLITRLIDQRTRRWDPAMVRDPVQDRLAEIIEQKKKARGGRRARKAAAKPQTAAPSNVIDIMDALKRSLATEKKGG